MLFLKQSIRRLTNPSITVYPLRPEFIESNLFLYQATRDDFFLDVAELTLHNIVNKTRVECGIASVLNIHTGQQEDKQPSYALSETLKYLYLTFDEVSFSCNISESVVKTCTELFP